MPKRVFGGGYMPDDYVCPVCGQAWDGEEAQMCNLCGEYHHPNDMASEHCCKACAEKRMTLPIMKRYIKETGKRAAFYVEYITSSVVKYASEDLMDIAEEWFDKVPADDKVQDLRDYIQQDAGDFAAWLEDADNV